ncbi:MAG TPA: hypothetical protein DCY79_20210, partial [Planctomycetaceae bacterium]|nr:hypothetical protein [Planctomycetaceae bacterium]
LQQARPGPLRFHLNTFVCKAQTRRWVVACQQRAASARAPPNAICLAWFFSSAQAVRVNPVWQVSSGHTA